MIIVMIDNTKLEASILKTGYPLEYQVAKAFQRHGWSTINSKYYVDDVHGVAREIDVVAYKIAVLQDVQVCTAVLISCKRSDHDAWALIAQDKNERDPNTDWYPLHAWTNQKVLRYFLHKTSWKQKYVGAARSNGFFKSIMYPEHHIFAFQLLNKDSGKTQDSRKIFDAVSSLMKAQGYEIGSREKADKLPSERIMNFNLLSVAQADMLLCKLDEADDGKVHVSIEETDRETYIASHIINQEEVVARVNFVKFEALELVLNWLDEMSEFNVRHFEGLIDDYYANPFSSMERSRVLKDIFERKVLHWIQHGLPAGRDKEGMTGLEFWPRKDGDELLIELDVWMDGSIETLNAHEKVRARVQDALLEVYRYSGPFRFIESDIPF